jgi:hypothetical protein
MRSDNSSRSNHLCALTFTSKTSTSLTDVPILPFSGYEIANVPRSERAFIQEQFRKMCESKARSGQTKH